MKSQLTLILALVSSLTCFAATTQHDLLKAEFAAANAPVTYSELPMRFGRDNPLKCVYVLSMEPDTRSENNAAIGRYEIATDPNDPLAPASPSVLAGPFVSKEDLFITREFFFKNTTTVPEDSGRTLHTKHRSVRKVDDHDYTLKADFWLKRSQKGYYVFKMYQYIKAYELDRVADRYDWVESVLQGYGYCWK